jgi:RNA polymerase sigma-70 factor (ECF subfamily)
MHEVRARVAEIYRRHGAAVLRRARALLGDEAEAREVVQDLFVSLLERPAQFEGRSTLSTFLHSATTHACLNRLRDQRNRVRLLHERGAGLAPQERAQGDALVHLRQALSLLPAQLAEVAVYYYVDELSQRELAALLGCSRRQVSTWIEELEAWGRQQEEACSAQ